MKQDVAIIGGGVIGVACAVELARRGAQVVGARARSRRARLLVRQRRMADAVAGGAAGQPEHAAQVVQVDARSREPALHSAASRSRVPPLAGRVPARVAQGEVRARRRGAGRAVPRERGPLGGRREAVAASRSASSGTACWPSTRTPASLEAAARPIDLVCHPASAPSAGRPTKCATASPPIVGPQVGGYFYPDDAHCEPYQAVQALAPKRGRSACGSSKAPKSYRISNGAGSRRRSRPPAATSAPAQIVLAAGPWSEPLGKMLGLRVPILGAKGYSLVLPPATRIRRARSTSSSARSR